MGKVRLKEEDPETDGYSIGLLYSQTATRSATLLKWTKFPHLLLLLFNNILLKTIVLRKYSANRDYDQTARGETDSKLSRCA